MNQSKIFRRDQPDHRLNEPFPDRSKTVKTIDLTPQGGFLARYRKSRLWGLLDDDCLVAQRTLHCWMFVEGEQVGAFDMCEYFVDPTITDDYFLDAMDRESAEAVELADIICRNWPNFPDTLVYFGPVVLLHRLWVSPRFARRSEWVAIAQQVLERAFRRRSIIALKAFPLEYEGEWRPGDDPAMGRLHRALIRHYRRLLGVVPFPGDDGEDGWLYAIPDRLKKYIPPVGEGGNSDDIVL
jgi:hypothetical protein